MNATPRRRGGDVSYAVGSSRVLDVPAYAQPAHSRVLSSGSTLQKISTAPFGCSLSTSARRMPRAAPAAWASDQPDHNSERTGAPASVNM